MHAINISVSIKIFISSMHVDGKSYMYYVYGIVCSKGATLPKRSRDSPPLTPPPPEWGHDFSPHPTPRLYWAGVGYPSP